MTTPTQPSPGGATPRTPRGAPDAEPSRGTPPDPQASVSAALAPAPAAAPLPRRRLPAPLQHAGSRYAVIGVWGALIVFYWLTEPGLFMTIPSFQTIFGSQQPLVFMTAALLCTIIVGEFVDLSVPAVYGFAATILPVLVVRHGWPVWAAAIVAVLGALAVGVVNGFLVVKVHVNTVVVTLGMWTLIDGISMLISSDNTISGLPSGFSKIALTEVGGLPISFYYGVAAMLGFAYMLWFTPLGRHMRFVGASREVSRLSGVRVDRIRFGAFVVAALLSGVGAVIATAAVGAYNTASTDANLLPVFAAVFLGTAIIEPGRFNPIGTFIGLYFLETGILGLQLHGLQNWVTNVFYGGVLVVAVTISTLLGRRATPLSTSPAIRSGWTMPGCSASRTRWCGSACCRGRTRASGSPAWLRGDARRVRSRCPSSTGTPSQPA